MEAKEFKALLNRYHEGKTSSAENASLESWYLQLNAAELADLSEADLVAARNSIAANLGLAKPIKLWPRLRIATGIAAAVATIVFGVWFSNQPALNLFQGHPELVSGSQDIAPGKSGATITLSTGEVIQLSEAKKGVIVGDVLKYDDGSVISSTEKSSAQERDPDLRQDDVSGGRHPELVSGSRTDGTKYTASTSKGQTYEFTLPDGTHVFLNANSKIVFPSKFSGKERRILLEGEAYFAVVHNEKQPFRVESKDADGRSQVVEDIGTEFNINAYKDESSIKTTLVEGSAGVYAGTSLRTGVLITPNQQASLYNGKLSVKTVDPEQAIAWREGYFVFDRTRLDAIMRQVARWYNVEVVYEDEAARALPFSGNASRYDNVSRILATLANTNVVKFELKDKKIIVKR